MASIIPDLLELFGDSITHEAFSSQDSFGAETYASGVARACHIEGASRLVRDPAGQERVSSVQVYLAGAFNVSVKDRITLPAPWSPTQPAIIAVGRDSDEDGAHNEIIFC